MHVTYLDCSNLVEMFVIQLPMKLQGELLCENMKSGPMQKDHFGYGYIKKWLLKQKQNGLVILIFSLSVEKYFTPSLCTFMKYF